MHRLFAPVIAPLIEAAQPRAIVEVGAGAGRLTRRLLEAPGAAGATVHAIDPVPTIDPELREAEAERLVVHAGRAISVLGSIEAVDLALLDGDPNWHSVFCELRILTRAARGAGREAPLIVVHNVHWPYGRRDGYYDPEAVPPPLRHECTELGLVPGHREPSEEGLRLVPWSAVREFEPRSGVLTAVEDFVAGKGLPGAAHDWTLIEVPGFHGVAVLAEAGLLARQPALAAALEDLRSPRFLGQQARHAESARLAAELELAAAKRAGKGAVPLTEAPEPVAEPAEPEPRPEPLPTAERDELVAAAARERAGREAFEWRLQRLEEDLAKHVGRLETLASERGEASERLRVEAEQRERELAERDAELREAVERAQLAEGRLAHSADLADALREERDRLRAEAERLRSGAEAARASLEEVAVHLERVEAARGGRLTRWIARAFGGEEPPSPLEEARAAAERGLSPPPEAGPPGEPVIRRAERSMSGDGRE